jgi:hypothetical protein
MPLSIKDLSMTCLVATCRNKIELEAALAKVFPDHERIRYSAPVEGAPGSCRILSTEKIFNRGGEVTFKFGNGYFPDGAASIMQKFLDEEARMPFLKAGDSVGCEVKAGNLNGITIAICTAVWV